MNGEEQMTDRESDDALAAEFVLGVLDEADRLACEKRMQSDAGFANAIQQWQIRLSAMDDGFSDEVPPAGLKAGLDQRLFGNQAKQNDGFWSRLWFWRGLSGAALAGFVAVVLLLVLEPGSNANNDIYIASLSSETSDDSFIVLFETGNEPLRIQQVSGEIASDRDYELWLIVGNNPPSSLGLINGQINTSIMENRDVVEGVTLAVSLEPKGGSITGLPTGPVIAVGIVKKI